MLKFRVFKGFLAELLRKLPKFHIKVTFLKEILENSVLDFEQLRKISKTQAQIFRKLKNTKIFKVGCLDKVRKKPAFSPQAYSSAYVTCI